MSIQKGNVCIYYIYFNAKPINEMSKFNVSIPISTKYFIVYPRITIFREIFNV